MKASKRKKPTYFVMDRDRTRLFVRPRHCGIHHLVVLCDGLTLTFFGKRDGPYLAVEDVIAWHEKELAESNGRSGNRELADAFRHALEKFKRGEVEEVSPC